MSELDIAKLKPSAFFGAPYVSGDMDATVRDILSRHEGVLRAAGTDEYSLGRFRTAAFNFVPVWLSLGIDLRKLTALEIGCGRGLKGLAWAGLFDRYIGVDLDATEIDRGRALLRPTCRSPDDLILGNAVDVIGRPGGFGIEGVDVLVLYAILEHLTPEERIEIFRLAREMYARGKIVLVAESPNRLYPFDHHSTHMHFVQMLPDDLARQYLKRSPNESMHAFARSQDPAEARTQLYRSGRALSYHDFEVHFMDLDRMRIAADGYAAPLLAMQAPVRAELDVLAYLQNNELAVPRGFSRAWLDFMLWKDAPAVAAKSIRLLPPVGMPPECLMKFWQLDRYTPDRAPDRTMIFEVPGRSARVGPRVGYLILEGDDPASAIDLLLDGQAVTTARTSELRQMRPPTWHSKHLLPVALPDQEAVVTVRARHDAPAAGVHGLLIDEP
ncbi:MAG: class I SAM-dependent methyltransferase [Phycisphaerales bacterium]|nr:class I SAM-dependent methyltransferase [Phycisphaerales bacterium]